MFPCFFASLINYLRAETENTEEEQVEGRWSRTTRPGEAASSKGPHSRGRELCSGKCAQSRGAAYKYYN